MIDIEVILIKPNAYYNIIKYSYNCGKIGANSGGLMLMDRRHTRECIAERVVPEPHSELKFIDISCRDLTQGLYIGGSCASRQIYVHNIELSGRSGNTHAAAGGLSGLLSAATFSGMKVIKSFPSIQTSL